MMHGIATRTLNDYQDYTALYVRLAGHEPPIPERALLMQGIMSWKAIRSNRNGINDAWDRNKNIE
jgi:hypothetical protein